MHDQHGKAGFSPLLTSPDAGQRAEARSTVPGRPKHRDSIPNKNHLTIRPAIVYT
jgi:hypothetical protein